MNLNQTTDPQVQAQLGRYHRPAIGTIEIILHQQGLAGRIAGLPDGFEIPMRRVGPETYLMQGGFFQGIEVQFAPVQKGSSPSFTLLGQSFQRLGEGEQPHSPLQALAPMPADPQRDAAFEDLYRQTLAVGPGVEIAYQLPYPKHEFVRYLAAAYQPIFHGSNKHDISRFEPRRNSVELYDETGRGNLAAVYGTHYPVWSMFFAVIDRSKGRGAINNGVFRLENAAGETLDVYQFAVTEALLAADPWVEGMLYILPADTFVRMQAPHGQLLNEWASREPVTPLARLRVAPHDFPFLEQVGSYRDPLLERLEAVNDRLDERLQQAELIEGAVRMQLGDGEDLAELLEEYTTIVGQIFPQVRLTITPAQPGAPVWLELRGPEAVLHTLEKRLQDLGFPK